MAHPRPPRHDVVAWRSDLLIQAGCEPELAWELAGDGAVDLHDLLTLIDRGCPPQLAARILAPLDRPSGPLRRCRPCERDLRDDGRGGRFHQANPRHWPHRVMRRMMKRHLDQTVREAVHRLRGRYGGDVRDYDEIHHHILQMADRLSTGIIRQFPGRFR